MGFKRTARSLPFVVETTAAPPTTVVVDGGRCYDGRRRSERITFAVNGAPRRLNVPSDAN